MNCLDGPKAQKNTALCCCSWIVAYKKGCFNSEAAIRGKSAKFRHVDEKVSEIDVLVATNALTERIPGCQRDL